ncbi:UNVERIFIED_CONTAM: Retrovirus-related Pol polyprotein from transposon [Sesamum radiatum]|uniref:Retrovirus-related Pol polyprotein from transposon n=1 Tax=Sesamum radiatum TaxID=300843 RepID=A0AAW2VMK6_SESRA
MATGHIEEIQFPEWLSNVVLVPKPGGKWRMCIDFRDLNKACPKDFYPLPRIDQLVDSTSGCELLSMMDASQGYHQIMLAPEDRKKAEEHVEDLEETFSVLRKYKLKFNPAKCAFGVQGGRFLGFMVSQRGIEANHLKIKVIIDMKALACLNEVQRLTGKIAALSRFISKFAEKSLLFFKTLRKAKTFEWGTPCQLAFEELKAYLARLPLLVKPALGETLYLYLSVAPQAISSVLIREEKGKQLPIYYVSKVLNRTEGRYTPIEKMALALVVTARSAAHIVITTPQGEDLEFAIKFGFKASNNEAEYEALVIGMRMAHETGARHLLAYSDSQLVVKQNPLAVQPITTGEDWRTPIIKWIEEGLLLKIDGKLPGSRYEPLAS